MKPDIAGDGEEREPLQQAIEVGARMTDKDDVITRLRDRFGVGD
jgi:hypothetical protein